MSSSTAVHCTLIPVPTGLEGGPFAATPFTVPSMCLSDVLPYAEKTWPTRPPVVSSKAGTIR